MGFEPTTSGSKTRRATAALPRTCQLRSGETDWTTYLMSRFQQPRFAVTLRVRLLGELKGLPIPTTRQPDSMASEQR